MGWVDLSRHCRIPRHRLGKQALSLIQQGLEMQGLLVIFRLTAMSSRFLYGLFDTMDSFVQPITFTLD
jgi:hypothetical protein